MLMARQVLALFEVETCNGGQIDVSNAQAGIAASPHPRSLSGSSLPSLPSRPMRTGMSSGTLVGCPGVGGVSCTTCQYRGKCAGVSAHQHVLCMGKRVAHRARHAGVYVLGGISRQAISWQQFCFCRKQVASMRLMRTCLKRNVYVLSAAL